MHPLFRHIRATHTADLNRFTPLFLGGKETRIPACGGRGDTERVPAAAGAPMTDFISGTTAMP